MEDGQKTHVLKPKRKNYVKKVEHEWSHQEVERLISAVEERRILWDMGTPQYKLPKGEAWQEVANAIGNVKVDDAKGKWTNLRISFKNNLAKYRIKKSGQGKDEQVVIHWRYFKSMMFLEANDIQQSTESTSSLPLASLNTDASILADFPVEPPPSFGIEVGRRKRRANGEVCPALSPTPDAKSMREMAFNALSSFTVTDDRFSAFGQYVAAELRALPPEQGVLVQRGLTRELLRLTETFETPIIFADYSGEDTDVK